MKTKVLHIIKSLGRGGAEMLLPETLQLHDQEKFEFHYIYFLPWKDQMVSAIEEVGGKVTCFSANNNIQLMRKMGEVKKYIKQNDIQLIHAHLPWAGFLARFIHRSTKIPVIYTEHNKQERYHRITFMLNKLTFGWQNTVVAVSQDVKESIKRNIGAKTKIRTVLNGVNTDKFQRNSESGISIRKQHNISEDAIVVGNVAVFRFQKRLVEWLQAFKKASDQNPKLFGIIVGDGPLKEDLLQERKKLGLEDKVLMPGLQMNTIDWFSAMDVFMMTSVFEGLPIALLESMSMACAIVTTDAGGIKEVIINKQDGLMVDVDDWEKLSEKLIMLTQNPDQIRVLGSAARERVVNAFSLKNMVDELEELYISHS